MRSLLKIIVRSWLGYPYCFAQAILAHIDTPAKGAARIVAQHYRGSGPFREEVKKGSSDGPLLLNIVKLYHANDYKNFRALGRVISGKVKKGERLKVMGEAYISGDE